MQFKVPQNIDMADRIVGPLTLVQFLYLLVGGIVIYFLLNTVAPINTTLFFALSVPIALFSLALAFLKVQDQPFPRFVAAFFVFLFKPKSRVWYKAGQDPNLIIATPPEEKKDTVAHKTINRSQVRRLVKTIDSTGHEQPSNSAQPSVSPPNYLKRSRPVLDNVVKGHRNDKV